MPSVSLEGSNPYNSLIFCLERCKLPYRDPIIKCRRNLTRDQNHTIVWSSSNHQGLVSQWSSFISSPAARYAGPMCQQYHYHNILKKGPVIQWLYMRTGVLLLGTGVSIISINIVIIILLLILMILIVIYQFSWTCVYLSSKIFSSLSSIF